ncbi:hypothetical protein H9Q70_002403 [Fusarium xylarioides]|nr:hypothetical protein H9Q70_002403 [Fusarium xylarioides]
MFDQAVSMILNLGSWRERTKAPGEMGSWHLAALFGLVNLAESLSESPDIDARDNCGRTALVWAMECLAFGFQFKPRFRIQVIPNFDIYLGIDKDRCRVVKALLASRASPHMLGHKGNTPLHLAAILGDVDIIERLFECGASFYASNEDGNVPLVVAVRHGRESAYMALLERGSVDVCGKNSRTALIEAASVGNLALTKKLIGKGAKVDHSDTDGQTALMEASTNGHSRLVELLLENQSEVNHQDHKGDTALIKACIGDHTDIIGLLLAANARLDIKNGREETAFDYGVRCCREGSDSIKRLLNHSTDPATRDQRYSATLVSASSLKRPGIVSLILEDATFKPTQEHLDLALSKSCEKGNEKVVRLLIDHGANPNMSLNAGGPSIPLLMSAICSADDAVVLMLLDSHINVQCVDYHGEGPMHAAAARGTKTMVQALIEMGIPVNVRTPGGQFPLDFAMRRQDNDTSIADLLREHGAITEGQRLSQLMRDRMKGLK